MHLLQIHEPGQSPLPHAEDDGLAVGIDLGTTHSVVAIARSGKAEVLRDMCGGTLVPSVVYYGEKVEVGKQAMTRLTEGKPEVVRSIKRRMDRAGERIAAGKHLLTPVEISADILRHLKALAETALGKEVTRAVITVPAYFDDAARQATKDAALLAGLDVLRLINEPTSAALAYGLDSRAEGVYAVYDLGGGTFDISLLKLEKGVFQVLATGGDTQLGGDDFDALIATYIRGESKAPPEEARLLLAARRLKETLSEREEVILPPLLGEGAVGLARAHNNPHLNPPPQGEENIKLTRAALEKMIAPLVGKTLAVCRDVLRDANLTPAQVKGVVLVGGSTRIPYVRAQVAALFGTQPIAGVNPDEVVAVGAALQAEALTQGSDNLLLDVVPLSLGLETMGGITEKIIHRNTPIPITARQEFTTYQDGQTGMAIHVVQGERELVAENRSLGRFELSGIPPMVAGAARIRVTFTVDADGLLTVSAEETTAGVQQHIAVKPSYGLALEEVERMLKESMARGAEDMQARLLIEARVDAQRLLHDVAAALRQDGGLLVGDEGTRTQAAMAALQKAIEKDDRDAIIGATERLSAATEDFAARRMDNAVQKALAGHKVSEFGG